MPQTKVQPKQETQNWSKILSVFYKLTAPSSQIEEIEQQYQARYLASLLLAFISLATLSVAIQLLTVPGFAQIFPALAFSLLVLGFAYGLSRTQYFKWGAAIAIFIPSIAVFVNLAVDPAPSASITFLLISILLSSVLFSWWWAFAVVVLDVLAAVLMFLLLPTLDIAQVIPSLFLVVIASGLILVNIRHRNTLEERRKLEVIESEKRYRMLINQSPFSTVVYSPEGRPQFYNQSAIKFWQVSQQDLNWIRNHYNILEDEQFRERGIMRYIEQSFEGYKSTTPPSQYKFQRIGVDGHVSYDERWVVSHLYPILDDNNQVREVVIIHEDISERLNDAQEIEQRNRELTLLNRIISVATSSLQQEDILQFTCGEITSVFGISHAIAILLNENKSDPTVVSACIPEGTPHIVGETMSAQLFKSELLANFLNEPLEPMQIEDVQNAPELAELLDLFKQLKLHSVLLVPLVLRQVMIGMIVLGDETIRIFDQKERNLAASIASAISQALQNARLYAEIQHYSSELETRVAQRTADLEEANQQLQSLSKIKDEFVSNVSHELRTPISNIKLYHDLLTINPKKQDTYIATLLRETSRLEHIVENLLHLSRFDQDRIPLKLSSVNVNALTEVQVTDRILQAQQRQIDLIFQDNPDLPQVKADMMQISQALDILLTNALNYATAGGQVIVRMRTARKDDQEWVTIRVSDDGPGISAEDQKRLFERFFRGEAGIRSKAPGTGLGLAIAKEIIDRHQGNIDVQSDGIPGEGTTFTIWLPVTL